MTLTLISRSRHLKYSNGEPCGHSVFFFLHILINIIRNLNIFCVNVDIHEMLVLQKKKGQGINTFIVIFLCSSLMSLTLFFPVYLAL